MARIYCSNCGQMAGSNVNFCSFCGAAQRGPEAAVYDTATEAGIGRVSLQGAENKAKEVVSQGAASSYPLARETVETQHLSIRAVFAFMVAYAARTFLVLLLGVVMTALDPLAGILGLVAYFIILLLVALLAWNNFYFSVDDTSFKQQYGIFHKYNVTIPFEQIQNVNILRSLIDQLFGLARIDIETAGDARMVKKSVIGGSYSKAEGHLPGVTIANAKLIHDILLQKVAVSK